MEIEPRDYQEVIDQALGLVYSHHHRFVSQLYPDRNACRALTVEEMRRGQLGQDLKRLALLAAGAERAPKSEVLQAIDSVLQILFWPVAAEEEEFTVPRSFWDTELGRMLALAKYRAFERGELVSIGSAAQQLGVTRPTIYRWMDDRTLNYVRDDMSGRTYVVRRDIEDRKTIGAEAAVME